ncbi:ribosomal-protein-alanine N-acetyltransferase [Limimaricola soesokkakensis]|uniref:Acetyltransferase (GNAT) family protein n=1 Tax=Limimaricola soesokkakensis TaxID=1343159 RepID=A0A1X6YVZ4_9RHOB|nr:ribosomal-protein-alanine N-acetyltransferase [Limimaricola soesokkakensis]SLN32837.1 Acetyltransferase (GNAT) family protein [Limimaricola soesokkakensis]
MPGRVTPEFRLEPLEIEDAEALAAFEMASSDWFEREVPPRPAGYFDPETLRGFLRELLEGPEAGRDRFYLVRSPGGEIMGRVNLTGLTETPEGLCAEVGYRIGPDHAGRGLAKAALAAAIALARDAGIARLEAKVATRNAASIRVLEANGFTPTGRDLPPAELRGVPLQLLHYARAI